MDTDQDLEQKAISLVAPYCDIEDRLIHVPPSARVRGMYVKAHKRQLAENNCEHKYREFFPNDNWSAIRTYPLRDYLIRLAVAGACLRSPKAVHEGMFEIWRTYAVTFTQSVLGRTMLRVLSRDPIRMMEQGNAAHRQIFLYGKWDVVRHSERKAEMVYHGEYIWIESAIEGGAVGAFEACGVKDMKVETHMTDRFNGSTIITW